MSGIKIIANYPTRPGKAGRKEKDMTTKEIKELKKEVKAITGKPMNSFEIIAFNDEFITIKYFANNHAKALGRFTYQDVKRK